MSDYRTPFERQSYVDHLNCGYSTVDVLSGGELSSGPPVSPDGEHKQIGGHHYSRMKIQPVEFIVANDIDYLTGNAIKYLCRYKHKGQPYTDLLKAQHYVEMLIARERGEDLV